MSAEPPSRQPLRYLALALGVAAARAFNPASLRVALPTPRLGGFAAAPRDLRPADPDTGQRILAGAFVLGRETLTHGPGGEPFDRPSPSRRFAVALHRFGWLKDLMALGDAGGVEALRLILEWRRAFGTWNAFSWAPDVLERRVFNLACAARAIRAHASEAEAAILARDLYRQADRLLVIKLGPQRAAERAVVAAIAGATLAGRPGERLLRRAMAALVRALDATLTRDGGHASRSPQAALELLFDLSTLDDVLVQRGLPAPDIVLRAMDRMAATVRFFTLADGRLAAFQGGEELTASYVRAARAKDEMTESVIPASLDGYHRLEARALQLMVDGAPPAPGPWSVGACAQPLACEILAAGRRLIVNTGWWPEALGPQALRLADAASTASVGDQDCGSPLRGFPAQVLGPRLVGAYGQVTAARHEAPGAQWLELAHDGWEPTFGFRHERRLYLDAEADELRGEDRLLGSAPPGPASRRFVPFRVRFHLHPGVSALIARDKKSVLLRAEGDEVGWWLRNDALEVAIDTSVHFQGGEARRSQQIVLRGQARLDAGAAVRWKLTRAGRVDEPAAAGVIPPGLHVTGE